VKQEKKSILSKMLLPLFSREPLELEEAARRQLFTIFIILIIIPLLFFGTIQLKTGHPEYGFSDYIIAVILFGIIYSLRYLKKSTWNFRITALLLLLLLAYWIVTGAVNGAASMWIIAFPPFVFFLLGKKEGYIWTAILLIMSILFFYNPLQFQWVYKFDIPFVTRIMATIIMVIFFTSNYETLRIKFLQKIKEDQNRLEELVSARTMELRQKNEDLEDALYITKALNEDIIASEKKLFESEKRYRILADNATDLIWSMDMNLKFTYISPAMKTIYGYSVEEAMTMSIEKLNTPKSFEKIMSAWIDEIKQEENPEADPNRSMVLELEQIKKDGSTFWSEIKVSFIRDKSGEATGIIGVTRDVTERRKTQELLVQTEKMMTVGGLAAGMAHELNNPLSIIMNSTQNVRRRISPELQKNIDVAEESGTSISAIIDYMGQRKITEYISYIHDASKRASDIIRDMLMFSRKSKLKYERIGINKLIELAIELYSKDYDLAQKYDFKKIQIDRDFREDLPEIICVQTQIEQVLLNLFKNAAIAITSMHEKEHVPLIGISTRYDDGDIVVKVSDNGPGIDAETLEHIFEPFYTTRDPGKGTGLGLSVSYYIITTNHGGTISASSWPGKGTTVAIRIPAR